MRTLRFFIILVIACCLGVTYYYTHLPMIMWKITTGHSASFGDMKSMWTAAAVTCVCAAVMVVIWIVHRVREGKARSSLVGRPHRPHYRRTGPVPIVREKDLPRYPQHRREIGDRVIAK